MLAIHAAFRRDLVRLEHAVRRGPPLAPGVVQGWMLFRRELENHHRAEDEDLWPVLRARLISDGDRATVDAMYREHAQLPGVLATIGSAIESGAMPTVDRLGDLVREHLRHEEQDALPLVVAHLSDAEWHEFLDTERRKRRPPERVEFLTWVLDGADSAVTEPVLREIPRAGQFVYGHVLRPWYDRRRWWGAATEGDRAATSGPLARAG
jgi:Hemerythrin HHE cation binding domain